MKIINEFEAMKKEYKWNLETLTPEPGLKDINKFENKVKYALEKTAGIIETDPEPVFKVEYGNAKLPKTTIISSCGTWFNCPGRVYGFCDICQYCYDKCYEVMYKNTLSARTLKEVLFRSYDAETLAAQIINQCKKNTKLNRFNEVGELRNQEDLEKVIKISNILYDETGILSYIYTHNKGLNFAEPHPNLRINASGFNAAGIDNIYKVIKPGEKPPANSKRCICDCHNCNHCIKQGLTLWEELRP